MTGDKIKPRIKSKPFETDRAAFSAAYFSTYKFNPFPIVKKGNGFEKNCGSKGLNCQKYSLEGFYKVMTFATGNKSDLLMNFSLTMPEEFKKGNSYNIIFNISYNGNNQACESFIIKLKPGSSHII